MKVITQEEYNNFPIINGYKQCPSGDYTQIKYFKDRCNFGNNCIFGKCCTFLDECTFGNSCTFGEGCTFGDKCSFGNSCTFGEGCYFEKQCSFENGHVAKNGHPLISFNGFGYFNGTTYFFNCEDGIFVRCGGFFGDIEKFKKLVKESKKDNITKEYLMIVKLVKMKWKNY